MRGVWVRAVYELIARRAGGCRCMSLGGDAGGGAGKLLQVEINSEHHAAILEVPSEQYVYSL